MRFWFLIFLLSSPLLPQGNPQKCELLTIIANINDKFSKHSKNIRYLYIKTSNSTMEISYVYDRVKNRVILFQINNDVDQGSDDVLDQIVETGSTNSPQSLDGPFVFHQISVIPFPVNCAESILMEQKGTYVAFGNEKLKVLFTRPNHKFILLSADSYK